MYRVPGQNPAKAEDRVRTARTAGQSVEEMPIYLCATSKFIKNVTILLALIIKI